MCPCGQIGELWRRLNGPVLGVQRSPQIEGPHQLVTLSSRTADR
jgi:hypothetical protein